MARRPWRAPVLRPGSVRPSRATRSAERAGKASLPRLTRSREQVFDLPFDALPGVFVVDVAPALPAQEVARLGAVEERKSTRLNSSHVAISYAVFCLKKKKKIVYQITYEQKKKQNNT